METERPDHGEICPYGCGSWEQHDAIIAGFETVAEHRRAAQEKADSYARSLPLNSESLQVVIDSPNFREYEKAMAREIVRLRAVVSRGKS